MGLGIFSWAWGASFLRILVFLVSFYFLDDAADDDNAEYETDDPADYGYGDDPSFDAVIVGIGFLWAVGFSVVDQSGWEDFVSRDVWAASDALGEGFESVALALFAFWDWDVAFHFGGAFDGGLVLHEVGVFCVVEHAVDVHSDVSALFAEEFEGHVEFDLVDDSVLVHA